MMKPQFQTVGEITITNHLWAEAGAPALAVARKLVETSFQGAPVFDAADRLVGKVTEIDLLRALAAGTDLARTPVATVMGPVPPAIGLATPVGEAVALMERLHLLRLPVVEDGRFLGSVTRHDLLRSWLGLWPYAERG